MPLIPVTRNELKQLTTQADEWQRKTNIEKTIKEMYDKIVQFATKSTSTSVRFNVYEDMTAHMQQQHQYQRMGTFGQHMAIVYITAELIGDVVSGLRKLFPDSKIEYRVADTKRVSEPKMHDIDVDWS